MKFKHNIEVQSGIADNNNLTGDSGQILSSTVMFASTPVNVIKVLVHKIR